MSLVRLEDGKEWVGSAQEGREGGKEGREKRVKRTLILPGKREEKRDENGSVSCSRREENNQLDEMRLTVSSESPSVGFLENKRRKEGNEKGRSARTRLSCPNTSVNSLNSPTHGSLLHTDVLDDQVLNGDVLGLSVGLSVLEESEDESNRLLGPSSWLNGRTQQQRTERKRGTGGKAREDVSFGLYAVAGDAWGPGGKEEGRKEGWETDPWWC